MTEGGDGYGGKGEVSTWEALAKELQLLKDPAICPPTESQSTYGSAGSAASGDGPWRKPQSAR